MKSHFNNDLPPSLTDFYASLNFLSIAAPVTGGDEVNGIDLQASAI
jgi:hypothetical protein